MHVNVTKKEPAFKPVELTITLETKEDFDAFYQVTNYSKQVGNLVADCQYDTDLGGLVSNVLCAIWDVLHKHKQ